MFDSASFRRDVAKHMHRMSQISRDEIFAKDAVKCMPIGNAQDANTMFAGYVGKEYQPGGVVIFGINPGGGGDKYVPIPADRKFYPLLFSFKNSSENKLLNDFEAINENFIPIVKQWNTWRIIEPTLHAINKSLQQVVYLNAVPYRTRQDKTPTVTAIDNSLHRLIAPTLEMVEPKVIIALGVGTGNVLDRCRNIRPDIFHNIKMFTVQRTRGDKSVCPEAMATLDEIRSYFRK